IGEIKISLPKNKEFDRLDTKTISLTFGFKMNNNHPSAQSKFLLYTDTNGKVKIEVFMSFSI
ncbi:MAG TPA: hypothetical protein DCO75_04040, partial [Fibrobacteres bacterium]|nr:hypothetical protein [Fibrobacterota bacterium]